MKKQMMQRVRVLTAALMICSSIPFQADVFRMVRVLQIANGSIGGIAPAPVYIPSPDNIHNISIVPMVGSTPTAAAAITFDAPTSTAIKAAVAAGDQVVISLALNTSGTNVLVTANDVTAGAQLGNIALGSVSGTVASYVMNYATGGKNLVSSSIAVNANQGISIQSFLGCSVPTTSTFASFMFTVGGIVIPFNGTGMTAINTALAAGHDILFAVRIEGSMLFATATDQYLAATNSTVSPIVARASMSTQLSSLPAYSATYVTSTQTGASQSQTVQLLAGQVMMGFAAQSALNVPTQGALTTLSMTYVLGSQVATPFKFSANEEISINAKIKNQDNLLLLVEAVPNSSTTENIVVSVYDVTTGSIVTQKIIGSSVPSLTACTLTCTSSYSSQTVVTLPVGSGVMLVPVVVAAGAAGAAGAVALGAVPTLAVLKAIKTFSQFEQAMVMGTDTYLTPIIMPTNSASPAWYSQSIGDWFFISVGVNVWNYPQVTPWSKFPGINWANSNGVKFVLLAFDNNSNVIVDLTQLPNLNQIAPKSVELFAFDGLTGKKLGSASVQNPASTLHNFGNNTWINNTTQSRIDGGNYGNGAYPAVVCVNVPSVAITSASPSLANLATVGSLAALKLLLETTTGEQISVAAGTNNGAIPYMYAGINTSVSYNAPAYTISGYWNNAPEFLNIYLQGNGGVTVFYPPNQSADLFGVAQIMNWTTGVTFVPLAFDQNGMYMRRQDVSKTAPYTVYLYCFDTASDLLLGLFNVPLTTSPSLGTFNYNASAPWSALNTGWQPSYGWGLNSPYPAMARLSCYQAENTPPTSATAASSLGAATSYTALTTMLTAAGVTTLDTISLAGVTADFTSTMGIQYPNDLQITFGNNQAFTFPAVADLQGISAQVTDWSQGLIIVILAFDASGNMISTLPSVPALFYLFAYDAATENRIGIMRVPPSVITANPGQWVQSMTYALGASGSNMQNATYPASLVLTGPVAA